MRKPQQKCYGQTGYVSIQIWEIEEFEWWDLEVLSEEAGTQFTSTEFKE